MSFLLLLISSLQQNWRRGQNRFCLEARQLEGYKKEKVAYLDTVYKILINF
jgi:hypothetical protein